MVKQSQPVYYCLQLIYFHFQRTEANYHKVRTIGEDDLRKALDSFNYHSNFGKLHKKSFDSISHNSAFGGLDKKAFDSIGGASSFGGLDKRAFDSIGGASAFGGLDKRGRESKHLLSENRKHSRN